MRVKFVIPVTLPRVLPMHRCGSIRINASDLAKYTGHNGFCAPNEVAACFWNSNRALAIEYNVETPRLYANRTEEAIAKMTEADRSVLKHAIGVAHDAAPQALSRAVHARAVEAAQQPTNAGVDSALAATSADLIANLSLSAARQTADALEMDARVQRGIAKETESIDALEVQRGMRIVERNQEHLREKIAEWNGLDVILVGRVDGRIQGTGEVVEIKERRKRLFEMVPLYEQVQLHAYMHMTKTRRAMLRERFDRASAEHWVIFDDDLWSGCLRLLMSFLDATVGQGHASP